MGYLKSRPKKDIIAAVGFIAVVCLLIVSALWAYVQFRYSPPYVDPEKYPVRGIDISRHNGDIDFEKVAEDGIDFVFIKASEGTNYQDSMYLVNYDKAKIAGLKTGAYHFFRFDKGGVEQAVNFLDAIGNRRPDIGLVIDIEKPGNVDSVPLETIKTRLSDMIDYMNLSGHRVMIYTNFDGYYDYVRDVAPGYPLWICRFQENPIHAEWSFWQYDHHGKVKGVKGEVDLDTFCGGWNEWDNFLQGGIWPYTSAP